MHRKGLEFEVLRHSCCCCCSFPLFEPEAEGQRSLLHLASLIVFVNTDRRLEHPRSNYQRTLSRRRWVEYAGGFTPAIGASHLSIIIIVEDSPNAVRVPGLQVD